MKKNRILIVILVTVIILLGMVFVLEIITKNYNLSSEVIVGLFSSIIGGGFALLSVWVANEVGEIKKQYNDLPLKIRKISQLRDLLWELKSDVGQGKVINQVPVNRILDIAAEIDGNTYKKCVKIRDVSLEYHNKILWKSNDIGNQIFVDTEQFYHAKGKLYVILEEEYNHFLRYEDKLTSK